MKRKLLQLSFLVLIFAMAGLFVAFAYTGNQQPGSSKNAKLILNEPLNTCSKCETIRLPVK